LKIPATNNVEYSWTKEYVKVNNVVYRVLNKKTYWEMLR